jgi:hypothetical protein
MSNQCTLASRKRSLGPLARLALRAATLRELVSFLVSTGRWWLIPMVGVLSVTAGLLVVIQVIEYAAPFVYSIF